MEIAMIDEQRYQATMERMVNPAIARCAHNGYMQPAIVNYRGYPLPHLAQLGQLHYVCYDVREFMELNVPGAARVQHGTIVIAHGFSEFAAKYNELIWYFLLAGFSVCVLEHRGHGYSARDVTNDQIVYIDDWRRYVADFAQFTREIAPRYAHGTPIMLYGHSMGGGIGAGMLERYPHSVERAVLSAPMIEANMHIPSWIAVGACGILTDLHQGMRMAPGQHGFTPDINWKEFPGASRVRIQWFKDLRIDNTHYQTTAPANQWVREAGRLSHNVLRANMCERIEAPILLFQAGKDTWVSNRAEDEFVRRVQRDGGRLQFVRIDDAIHEIYGMPNAVMAPYVQRIIRFFQTDESVNVLP